MLHNCPKMGFMPGYIGDYCFHVHPDQFFQYNRPDEVSRTVSCVATVAGAYKMVLPFLKVVGGAVAHFCPAVSTVSHAGEQAALSGFCPSVTLLADLLHLVKDFLLNDCRMGVVEYRLLLNGRFPLLLVPDGVGVGLSLIHIYPYHQ